MRRPILVIVDDHHAAAALESVLDTLAHGFDEKPAVLTGDPLLCLRLRRAGYPASLTVDGLDAARVRERDDIALRGVARACGCESNDWSHIGDTRYGPFFAYTLIPKFIRTIRHLFALDELLPRAANARVVIVGHGELARAAALVAARRGLRVERVSSGPWRRARTALARLRAGRRVRWVNSDFRALLLEPAFLGLLALRGLLAPAGTHRDGRSGEQTWALVVTGDRFTREIAERLRNEVEAVIVAGATYPGRRLFRGAEGAASVETLGRADDLAAALWIAARSLRRAWGMLRDRRHHARFAVNGVNYWPLVRGSVAWHLVAWSPLLHHLARLVARAAARHPRARVVVSSDVTAYNRMLIEAARRAGFETLGVQHGILGEPNGHSTTAVDTLATWGTSSERWYRSFGELRTQFVVTGNPRFDELAVRVAARSATPHNRSHPFTVVICTGFVSEYSVCASEYENLLMLEAVGDWARAREGVRVVQKLHPGEELAYYEGAGRALGWSGIEMVRDVPLYDVLESADVLVASYSTTVLEAVALGTPAIVLDAIARRHHVPLDASPDVTIAFSVAELHAVLDWLRDSPDARDGRDQARRAFLEDYLNHLDGKATERVLALIRLGMAPATVAQT